MAGDHLCEPLCEGNFSISGWSIRRAELDVVHAGLGGWSSFVYFCKQVVWSRRVFSPGNFWSTEQLAPATCAWKWVLRAHCTNYAKDPGHTDGTRGDHSASHRCNCRVKSGPSPTSVQELYKPPVTHDWPEIMQQNPVLKDKKFGAFRVVLVCRGGSGA